MQTVPRALALTAPILLLFAPRAAEASEHWAACHDCTHYAQQFATGVPPDVLGVHRVNVYNDTTGVLRSFDVTVYLDYELRAWLRFARETRPTAAADAAIQAAVEAVQDLHELVGRAGPARPDIPDVQTFLGGNGRFDDLVRAELFGSLQLQGLMQRFLNTAVVLGSTAGQVVGSQLRPRLRVRFNDGSAVDVEVVIVANDLDRPVLNVVPGSATLPDGSRIPTDADSVAGYLLITDNAESVAAAANWIRVLTGRPSSLTLPDHVLPGTVFTFRCSGSECTLTAARP